MEKQFILDGYVIVTDWYGLLGCARLCIKTDERGLKEIETKPLQDYIEFGVQSVDYAFFEVYLIEIERTEKYTRRTYYHEPLKTIEAGDASCIKEMGGDEFLEQIWFHEEPASISY